MQIEVVLNVIWMMAIGLLFLLKPQWLLKLVLRSNSPEAKVKALTRVVQFLGVLVLVLTIVSIIRSLV